MPWPQGYGNGRHVLAPQFECLGEGQADDRGLYRLGAVFPSIVDGVAVGDLDDYDSTTATFPTRVCPSRMDLASQ